MAPRFKRCDNCNNATIMRHSAKSRASSAESTGLTCGLLGAEEVWSTEDMDRFTLETPHSDSLHPSPTAA